MPNIFIDFYFKLKNFKWFKKNSAQWELFSTMSASLCYLSRYRTHLSDAVDFRLKTQKITNTMVRSTYILSIRLFLLFTLSVVLLIVLYFICMFLSIEEENAIRFLSTVFGLYGLTDWLLAWIMMLLDTTQDFHLWIQLYCNVGCIAVHYPPLPRD